MALQTRNGSTGYICLRVVFTRHLHCMLLVYQSIRMIDLLDASPFFSPSTGAGAPRRGGGEIRVRVTRAGRGLGGVQDELAHDFHLSFHPSTVREEQTPFNNREPRTASHTHTIMLCRQV